MTTAHSILEDRLLTSEEAAQFLSVTKETIRGLANRREIASLRVGRRYKFSPAALKEYVSRKSTR